MKLSTLIPIPKRNNTKSLNDSSNYRAIALGSIGKVLDHEIMYKNIDALYVQYNVYMHYMYNIMSSWGSALLTEGQLVRGPVSPKIIFIPNIATKHL